MTYFVSSVEFIAGCLLVMGLLSSVCCAALIPLIAEHGLNEQLGSAEYGESRFFRRKLRIWLQQVKSLWPECPAVLSRDGCSIIVQSSRKSPAIRAVRKAVNL
jgi:hypothetical protein